MSLCACRRKPGGAGWVLTTLLFCFAAVARADGPHIAFHGTEGAYTVTLFTAPDPLVAGPAGLTLLVQNTGSGALLGQATASGQLLLAGHAPVAFTLGPADGGNLPSATVRLPLAGSYALQLHVAAANEEAADFAGTVPVAENHGRRNTVLWALLLPVLCIGLFLVNQYGKARMRLYGGRRAVPK